MKLIVGLGNPGTKFEDTRHNIGYFVVDQLLDSIDGNCAWKADNKSNSKICPLPTKDLLLVKPQTFMNDSGTTVSSLVNYYKVALNNTFVVHDDLDIKLGEYKIQLSKGPKDHKGILSIEEKLGTKDFYRVRIGVENRTNTKISGEDYVLIKFAQNELAIVDDVINKAIGELVHTISTT